MTHYVEIRSKRFDWWRRPVNVPTKTSSVPNRFSTQNEAARVANDIMTKLPDIEARVCSITYTTAEGA